MQIKLQTENRKYLPELIKRRSKVLQKKIPLERTLNFEQQKTFSGNCKPIRIWLWFVYKITIKFSIFELDLALKFYRIQIILPFWTKFSRKGYIQSNRDNSNIAIELLNESNYSKNTFQSET